MTIEELSQLGLSDKESELYLACVELGPSKAKDISAYTSLNRGTIYDVARSLFKKGLLSTTQKRDITHFVAHAPHQYIYQLERERAAATLLLPKVEELLQSHPYRPTVTYFEGDEGIRAVYEETLKAESKHIYCFAAIDEMLEVTGPDFMRYYTEKRTRRHISVQILHDWCPQVEGSEGDISFKSAPELLREARIAPEAIDVAGNFMVYGDCIAMMSTKRENFGTILKSQEYATMFRNLFQVIWEISQPI
jgi:sugar-specific transcriptional regulator TrmB